MLIWISLAAFLPAAVGSEPPGNGLADNGIPAVQPRAPFDPKVVFDLTYISRPDSALAVLDQHHRNDPNDPFVLLLKAKVLRERLNDEDNDKNLINESTLPIHAVLDTAINICNEALDKDTVDPKYYFYRGYGWLNKAQLYVLTKGYWSAGRAAGRGKGDLERYLERYPDDPDALGMLGTYFYFADAIPNLVKLVAKLLLIPGGDREKGLEMLEYGATHEGLFTTDWRMVLAAVHLVFEGHFERGADEFAGLLEEYPRYTRLVEPLGVVAPMYPRRVREIEEAEIAALESQLAMDGKHIDWNLVKRMWLHQAFTNSYFGDVAGAMEQYQRLIEAPPDHPDWVLPISLLNHGYFEQRTGRIDAARTAYERVLAGDEMKFYHSAAKQMAASLDAAHKSVPLEDMNFVSLIYRGQVAEASAGIEHYKKTHGEDALTDFYSGDLKLFAQDLSGAKNDFERAVERKEEGGDQIYQMFAALRLAELHGQDGDIREAIEILENSKKFCHANYLLDFLIRSRKRFYELVKDGKIDSRPALLSIAGEASSPE